ncbi:DedA family protein [Actinokineospora spheciospongiae]|uniref:DedA family protein n=1 Tax=Actinokineospora spheciospongiae TaxID=909613 RepID=UPI000D70AFD9|nr:DedA family protein [Actinokineospora spheciospongiae]PWW63145.1 membrane protein DedA with SNARE-associated domain [Actinokineospora spheciospongiae]
MSVRLLVENAPEPVGGLADWAVGLMESLGGVGAALVVGLDNLFPPIPSELVLPLAGLSASRGVFSLAEALIWTTVGSVVGAVVVYLVGALLGRERTRALVGRVPLVKVSDFDRTERWFARHGAKAVFLGRMVPLFRSFISLPAGVERMRFAKFLALTTAGSFLWNAVFVVAGYRLGESWHLVEEYAGVFQKVVIGAVVLAVALFVVVRVRSRRDEAGPGGRASIGSGHGPRPR